MAMGAETAETTPHKPNTTNTDSGACNDLPKSILRIQGPASARSVQIGTEIANASHREPRKTRHTIYNHTITDQSSKQYTINQSKEFIQDPIKKSKTNHKNPSSNPRNIKQLLTSHRSVKIHK